jgi:1-acyl-sn-glycerol-3-phosphate acyltransferase
MDSPLLSPPPVDSVHDGPDPRDKTKYYFADTVQRRMLIALARALFKPFMKMKVSGLQHFPKTGPVIVAANHVTNFDVFPMQFAIPRVIFFMGKAELFKNLIMDVLIRNLSGFPVNRGDKDPWAMNHAMKILKQGQTLGMFPEGKRSKGRGLSVAKTGTARLAIEANCPIVPLALLGTDQFFKKFPHRTLVRISLLPSLHPKEGETPLALTDRLMFTLAQALPSAMRGVYAEAPLRFDAI